MPFDIRNSHLIDIGIGFTTGFGCRIEALPIDDNKVSCIKIGKNVQINDYVHIAAGCSISIGNHVLIASKVFISDMNHGSYTLENSDHPEIPPALRPIHVKPIVIGDNVWLGELVCILPGVEIGEGSIIGASSVVTKSIPPNSIAVGSPARIVKTFDFDKNVWTAVKS